MNLRYGALIMGAACALLPVLGGEKVMAMDNIESFKLDNGMKVVVVHDARAPVVTHSVWYKVGAMDEKPGKTGLAHMTEHLMFKGTEKFAMGEMDKIVQRRGGVQNAFTSYDYTAYYQKVPVTELETMMDLESDRMTGLRLTDAIFQPERKVVAEERKLTTDSNPSDRFFEQVMRRHYAHHTYGHPVIGWAADIQGYTFKDALDWYATHYGPDNATMILVGNVTAEGIKPMVEKYYGGIKSMRALPAREVSVEPLRAGDLSYIKTDPQVQVAGWHRIYRAPSNFQGVAGAEVVPGEATGLWILAEILGGGSTARLYQELVVKQQLADSASSDYHAIRVGESTFDVSVQPKDGVAADKAGDAAMAVIAKLLDEGVTEEELRRAKVSLKADEIYARDDPFTNMYRLGMWVSSGGKLEEFNTWMTEMDKLTVADVNALAQKYLKTEHSTLAVLAGNKAQLGTLEETKDQ
ncbi:MAG: insulinase family protein [Alphaproteobacteria bacterium]|nr:MAG: insulinase family protein [Alphaproteobacteria bacterium]